MIRTLWFVSAVVASSISAVRAGEGAVAPTLTRGTLAAGTEWATPWYATDSGVDGPVVLITGGIHGNEPAGSYAADQIRRWPVRAGKLIVVPRGNQKALEANVRATPGIAYSGGDLNRAFPRTGEPNKAKTELAEALWRFAERIKPDWVIDLHEGIAVHRKNPNSVGSSIVCRVRTRSQIPRATTRMVHFFRGSDCVRNRSGRGRWGC